MKISKELFEAVMNEEYDKVNIESNGVTGLYRYTKTHIHIDTFFFKCKEWAWNKDYLIWSTFTGVYQTYDINTDELTNEGYADTELEAVLKAVAWILENK